MILLRVFANFNLFVTKIDFCLCKLYFIAMNKLLEFISKQAYLFLFAGMIIIISDVVYLMGKYYQGIPEKSVVFPIIGGVGFFLYILGRIGLVLQKKNRSR